MRSGIGPGAHLRELGIDAIADMPGVGADMDDHPMLGTTFLARDGVLDLDSPLVQVTYRYTSSLAEERNDMQLMPVSHLPMADGRIAFTIGSVIERQKSRGRLTLTSRDPHVQPRIENRFLEHPDDVTRLVEGVRMALDIGARPEFEAVSAGLLSPREEITSDDAALASWCRKVASSGFHPSCTARMAPASDKMGVVDQRLRVRGFDNFYVADASVMPVCPRANIHLTSIMIGERMADWLRGE
jgi:choline dehydrogenase